MRDLAVRSTLILMILYGPFMLRAQMSMGGDTLYGNEWIDFEQNYYKIKITADGLYRIDQPTLQTSGLPDNLLGTGLRIHHLGKQVPLYVSTTGILQTDDYVEFFATKNRGTMDRHLYEMPDSQQLNPFHSMYTDTAVYFLSYDSETQADRYQEISNDIANPPAPEAYYMHEQRQVYSTNPYDPEVNSAHISYSHYVEGEGFAETLKSQTSKTLTTSHVFPDGPDALLQLRFATNRFQAIHEVSVQGKVRFSQPLAGNSLVQRTLVLAAGELSTQMSVVVDSDTRKHALSTVSLHYPRTFHFENATMHDFDIAAAGDRVYLEIQDFDHGNLAPILYDLTNNLRIVADLDGPLVKIGLPASARDRRLLLIRDSGATPISELKPVMFEDYGSDDTEYLMISHPALYQSQDGTHQLEAYKAYRSTLNGGSYAAEYYDIEKLYDQFAYGIRAHPMAVKNFVAFANRRWSNLQMVYIIGKAREYVDVGRGAISPEEGHFVPTWGRPGADNMLIAPDPKGLPIVPIGRLAVINGDELGDYLEKVKEYDLVFTLPQTKEDKAWTKRVLHLAGGRESQQQQQIQSCLNRMGDFLIEEQFGAEVHLFTKESTDIIGESQLQRILELIKDGTSVIKFYGHSGGQTLDFNINDPEEWNNAGKYPIFSAMGCSAGQIHGSFRSLSEDFVLQRQSGSIAFIAGSGSQYQSPLCAWGREWYGQFGEFAYGETLGETLLTSLGFLSTNGLTTWILRQQQTLNGDPAVRVHPHPGPDFIIDRSTVKLNPDIISTNEEALRIDFDILNLGQNVADTFQVKFVHRLPSGNEVDAAILELHAPAFRTSVSVEVPIGVKDAVGLNVMFIDLDITNQVIELPTPAAETNNSLVRPSGQRGLEFLVISNDLVPLLPEDYGIVGNQDYQLICHTSNPFVGNTNYLLEIDTSILFDSPFKSTYSKEQSGGIVSFDPDFNLSENTVYYWRVSPDSIAGQDFTWRQRSFVYLPDADPGWNQSHYYQYLPNTYDKVLLEENRRFTFADIFQDITVRNNIFQPGRVPTLSIGPTTMIYWAWDGPVKKGIQVAVFDGKSVDYWRNQPGGLYGSHLPSIPQLVDHANFPFRTDTEENRAILIDFLDNTVPEGDYVIVWSITRTDTPEGYMPDAWAQDSINTGRNLYQVFAEQGARFLRTLDTTGAVPFVFVYKKNDPSFETTEIVTENPEDEIDTDLSLIGKVANGGMQSIRIGPATNWDRLEYEMEELQENQDSVFVKVSGGDTPGSVFSELQVAQADLLDLQEIDAAMYPYLQLDLQLLDSVDRSAPQLNHWRVFYAGMPDIVFNPQKGFTAIADTVFQGQNISFSAFAENYTPYAMDSLLVKFTLIDANNNEQVSFKRIRPIGGNDGELISFSTEDLTPGDYEFIVVLNPDADQQERDFNNNIGSQRFHVLGDLTNPILDVTFDGLHIMNGDLVSSNPSIHIQLNDENEFVALSDTSLFDITLVNPSGASSNISFNDPEVTFIPASGDLSEKNQAEVIYNPEFAEDGRYSLFVQARDQSGNLSGDLNYRVEFEIITASMISNVFNYPNPFSSSTRFVYTLTGDIPPQHFKIQIMTVSGRVVREITELEIGELRIGTHMTEYAWDGRDEFGGKLAAGVYLYRILAMDMEGNNFDKLNNETDNFFEEDFGKMVIIR